jgi:hypothetical protein
MILLCWTVILTPIAPLAEYLQQISRIEKCMYLGSYSRSAISATHPIVHPHRQGHEIKKETGGEKTARMIRVEEVNTASSSVTYLLSDLGGSISAPIRADEERIARQVARFQFDLGDLQIVRRFEYIKA